MYSLYCIFAAPHYYFKIKHLVITGYYSLVCMLKYRRTAVVFTLFSIVLACCKSLTPAAKSATPTPSLTPDNGDLTVAQKQWPGTTSDILIEGYNLYEDKCTDCHDAKLPQDFSVEDWNAILPKMGRKAHLDSLQYKSVYRYILAKRETILSVRK